VAVIRPKYTCNMCGYTYREIHNSIEGFIGDSFIGYEYAHNCKQEAIKNKINSLIKDLDNGSQVITDGKIEAETNRSIDITNQIKEFINQSGF